MNNRVVTLGEVMLRLRSPGFERFFQSPALEATFGGGEGNVALSLANPNRPQLLTTVFAGQDLEATERAREYFTGYPPSSPSVALLKGGQLVYLMERHQIEGRSPEEIAADLKAAFDQHCAVWQADFPSGFVGPRSAAGQLADDAQFLIEWDGLGEFDLQAAGYGPYVLRGEHPAHGLVQECPNSNSAASVPSKTPYSLIRPSDQISTLSHSARMIFWRVFSMVFRSS